MQFEPASRGTLGYAVLSSLSAAGDINAVQLTAGERMRCAFEQAANGCNVEPRPESVKKAIADLNRAYRALGTDGYKLLQEVFAKDLTLAGVAKACGITGHADRKYLGLRFRECLDSLAVAFGCAPASASHPVTKSRGQDRN